jgi:CRP/FNR family transcriptional regulator
MAPNARAFRPGDEIISEGDLHGYDYWLRTGWVARTRRNRDERAQIITVPARLLLWGENDFLVQQPDAIEALSGVTVEFIDWREALEMARTHPDIAIGRWWQVCEDQRRVRSWVTGLGRGNAEDRIAAMLLDFRLKLHRAREASGPDRKP